MGVQMKFLFQFALVALLAATAATADVVTFKNGDRLSGRWARVEGNSLIFKSDSVGTVTIPLKKIESFSSTKPCVALLKGGQTIRGLMFLLPTGNWEFAVSSGLESIPHSDVMAILPEKTYRELGGEHHTQPWANWRGSTNFGYSLERGDTQSGTISTSVTADRIQPNLPGFPTRWRTHYNLQMLLAHAETVATGATVQSNTLTTSARQDYLFSPHKFIYGQIEFDHIQPQDLILRQTYGGGFGKDVRDTPRMRLSLLTGVTYVNEDYNNVPRRQSMDGFVGEQLGYTLTSRLRLTNKLDIYPNLIGAGLFRADTTDGLIFQLNHRLSLNTSVVDFYLARPPAGSKANNFTATTGLGINF